MTPLVAALLLGGCAKAGPPAPPPAEEPAATTAPARGTPVRENIDETTVGDLDGVSVPMGNMVLEGEYTLPDGTTGRGIACALVLPGGPVQVGLGSEVEVEGTTWRVVGIEKERGELGNVTLEKVE